MKEYTEYNLKIISAGANRIEIYKSNNYSIISAKNSNNETGRRGKEEISKDKKEENKKRRRKSTLTAARNNIVRLIKSNEDLSTFITLTFKKELNYKESKKCLQQLFKKLNYRYENLKYVWVLEFGSLKGRLHYHLLTNITLPKNINFCRSSNRKNKKHKEYEKNFASSYWPYGFVDIRSLQQENNTNIALYVSTYITKDLINKQLEGFRIYGYSSKTIKKPLIYKDYTDREIKDIIKDFSEEFYITYSNSYEIGYTTKDGTERKGTVSYIDMTRKKS